MKRLFIAAMPSLFLWLFCDCSNDKTQKKDSDIAVKKDFLFTFNVVISANLVFEILNPKPSTDLQTPKRSMRLGVKLWVKTKTSRKRLADLHKKIGH